MYHQQQLHDRNVQLLKNDNLGSGSYGVVCKAMWGQRLCAAKLLHLIFFQSNDPGIVTTRERFEQECRFLNDMKHPNIVEYLGTSHDPDSGLLVLLMELMDESLTHFLERSQQPLAYHIEVDLCHDIAQALVYIHSKDIIHRDLSGNNVLLLAGRAKITDFGMSKLLDSNRRMTPLTMCPGTLAYMSPEALCEPPIYSKKIDCFSFGVLQIQIITRQFPDPGPAMRVVEDSRSPTGTMKMPVLDSERRKPHIDLIDPTHTLLPTALSCLSYSEKDRPSAQDLCRQLAAFKEAPHYIQSVQLAQLRVRNEEQAQQIHQLQQQLQTKEQQLQDSQRHTHTLQQELQTKDQQLQQLTHQMGEKQHTIDDKETLLRGLQLNLLQHEQANKQLQDTVSRLTRDLQQAVEEKQHATGNRQLPQMKRPRPPPPQQKAITDMRWQEESKASLKMYRGSTAADANMAYFNGCYSTTVHSYDSDAQEWHRLPDAPHINFTLVVVHHTLTMVGGEISKMATDSLLSLMEEGRDKTWLPILPAMPTKRYFTAAVCSGHFLIVAGGYDGSNRLATVEVLDTDTRHWSIASSLTCPITDSTISICGKRLYMLGGEETVYTRSVLSCSIPELLQSCQPQPSPRQRILRTAPANQSTIWRQVADAPHYLSSCATLCGQLVAVGGYETSAITAYNETTDSWEAMGHMPTARCRALVAIFNGKMMVVGGLVGGVGGWVVGTETDVVEILC